MARYVVKKSSEKGGNILIKSLKRDWSARQKIKKKTDEKQKGQRRWRVLNGLTGTKRGEDVNGLGRVFLTKSNGWFVISRKDSLLQILLL